MTKTTEQPTMMQQVQQALETAPSRPVLTAAREKLTALAKQRDETKAEIARMEKEKAAGKDTPSARAAALLAGAPVSDSTMDDAISAAWRRFSVIEEAMRIQEREIRNLIARFSQEVNQALHQPRQQLVNRIAAALGELRAAHTEDAELRATVSRSGVDLTQVDNLVFAPVSADCAFDVGWLAARRQEGYSTVVLG